MRFWKVDIIENPLVVEGPCGPPERTRRLLRAPKSSENTLRQSWFWLWSSKFCALPIHSQIPQLSTVENTFCTDHLTGITVGVNNSFIIWLWITSRAPRTKSWESAQQSRDHWKSHPLEMTSASSNSSPHDRVVKRVIHRFQHPEITTLLRNQPNSR